MAAELEDIDIEDIKRGLDNGGYNINTGTVILVLLVLVVVSLFSAFVLYIVFGTDALVDRTGDIIDGLICDRADSDLIDATDAPCCAAANFIVTDIRYLEDINMTIGVNQVDYRSVCKGYCSKFNGNGCDNNTEDVDYQKCIKNLKPENCNGLAMPISKIGAQRYYGQVAGYQTSIFCCVRCQCALSTCKQISSCLD